MRPAARPESRTPVRVHWETAVSLLASLLAVGLLLLRVRGFQFPVHERDPSVQLPAFALAALLAAGFGLIAAGRLRASGAGRALSLFMALLAVVLVTPVAGPLPPPFGVFSYIAFWGAAGALVLLSYRLAGVATIGELERSRQLTALAGLVRPRQVAWVMQRRVLAWWAGLPAFVLLYTLMWGGYELRPGSLPHIALMVLFTVVATLPLAFMGVALSNVAARVAAVDARSWRATRWLLWAILASALCFVLASIPALIAQVTTLRVLRWVTLALMTATPLVLVLGVILAVVGFGAVDPSLALRRTASIGITGVVWVAVSALGEDFATRTMSSAVRAPAAASWAIVIGTALLLTPLQRWIERRLGGPAGK